MTLTPQAGPAPVGPACLGAADCDVRVAWAAAAAAGAAAVVTARRDIT